MSREGKRTGWCTGASRAKVTYYIGVLACAWAAYGGHVAPERSDVVAKLLHMGAKLVHFWCQGSSFRHLWQPCWPQSAPRPIWQRQNSECEFGDSVWCEIKRFLKNACIQTTQLSQNPCCRYATVSKSSVSLRNCLQI